MAERRIVYRLPIAGAPRVTLETDYGLRGGRLLVGDRPVLALASKETLLRGATTLWEGRTLSIRLIEGGGEEDLELLYDGKEVLREDWIIAPTARSAWIHAFIALAASFFGFVASYLYLMKSEAFADPWSLKMAIHMAGWHLLLTLTLFPASVWGQRIGIRSVQVMSALFFAIHLGIALANTGDTSRAEGPWIAFFNAASGIFFAAAVVYGQRAYRDMDPARAVARAFSTPEDQGVTSTVS